MEAQLVTAPGDGIGPAVLLTLGRRLEGQYLFSIPEGFSRFVLEHKVRPTSNLRAAFATDLQSLAGFGGLLMRLRNEGHGQVHIMGPTGTQEVIASLRHFIHWKHPAVLISELSEGEAPVCYEDEHIGVAALWKPPLVAELWRAPSWLLAPALSEEAAPAGQEKSSSSSSSSETSSGSSSSETSSGEDDDSSDENALESSRNEEESDSSEGDGMGDSSSSDDGRHGGDGGGAQGTGGGGESSEKDETIPRLQQPYSSDGGSEETDQEGQQPERKADEAITSGEAPPLSMFDELDQIFLRGAGGATAGHSALTSRTRTSVLERLRAEVASAPAAIFGADSGAAQQSGNKAGGGDVGVKQRGAATAAAAAAPSRRRLASAPSASTGVQQAPAPVTRGEAAGDANAKVYIVDGKPYRQLLSAPGINAWAHEKLSAHARAGILNGSTGPAGGRSTGSSDALDREEAGAGSKSAKFQGASPHLLGYLLHIKATDRLLLVSNIHGKAAVRQLAAHPALERMRQQSRRVSGSVLMVTPGLRRSPQFRRLVADLPGQHILLEHPGAGTEYQEIGHLAAARTTAKLHLVAPSIFPLPAALEAACSRGMRYPPEKMACGRVEAVSRKGDAAEARPLVGEEEQQLRVADAATLEEQQNENVAGADSPAGAREKRGQVINPTEGNVVGQSCQSIPSVSANLRQPGQLQPVGQSLVQDEGRAVQVRLVRHLSKAVWVMSCQTQGAACIAGAGGPPSTAAVASGASAPPLPLLHLEPAEVFTPEAAAGKGEEGRSSGANPCAVWRELKESKKGLSAKLSELVGVVEAMQKLPDRPRTPPAPNTVQPPQQQQQRQQLAPAPAQGAVPGRTSWQGTLPQQVQQSQHWFQQQQQLLLSPSCQYPANPRVPIPAPFQHIRPFGLPTFLQPHLQYQPVQMPAGFLPQVYPQPPRPPAPLGMMWVLQPAPGHPQPTAPQYYSSQPLSCTYPGPVLADPHARPASGVHAAVPEQHAQHGMDHALGSTPPPLQPAPPSAPHPLASELAPLSGRGIGGRTSMLGKRPSAAQQAQQKEQSVDTMQLSNKRAAADLRAKLQRKPSSAAEGTLRQQPGHSGAQPRGAVPSINSGNSWVAVQQGEQEMSVEADLGVWMKDAPECLRSLAAAGDGSQVVFLGTGSAEPSKYRGASAIHIRLDSGHGLLLDCGEGCLGQMERLYGHKAAMQHVAGLGCIWLSHRHADHMLGLLGVLAAYPSHLPPLLVVGPYSARDWLREVAPHLRLRYVFAHCTELNSPGHWARQQLAEKLGISCLESVGVRHCSDAYGVVLGHRAGWRVVYSGDTQPCDKLVEAGRGCTLLIHEATFEPCLADQAARKRHSTTDEALAVAQDMGAYRTILTHFSQRYPKFPDGLPAEGPAATSTAIAFDGMCVPLASLPLLPALRPVVEYVLASDEEQGQEGLDVEGAATPAAEDVPAS